MEKDTAESLSAGIQHISLAIECTGFYLLILEIFYKEKAYKVLNSLLNNYFTTKEQRSINYLKNHFFDILLLLIFPFYIIFLIILDDILYWFGEFIFIIFRDTLLAFILIALAFCFVISATFGLGAALFLVLISDPIASIKNLIMGIRYFLASVTGMFFYYANKYANGRPIGVIGLFLSCIGLAGETFQIIVYWAYK